MSYSTPELEAHIRARALAIAEAVSASHPAISAFAKAREELRQDTIEMDLPSDTVTWFALQRVAGRSNVQAARLQGADLEIPAGALVLVDACVPAPKDVESPTIKSLKKAAFVVAPAQWRAILDEANVKAFRVSPSEEDAPAPSRRAPGL